jgi:hypothetical protein
MKSTRILPEDKPLPRADIWQVQTPLTDDPLNSLPDYVVLTRRWSQTPRFFLRWSRRFNRFVNDDNYRWARQAAGEKVLTRITRMLRRYHATWDKRRGG